MGKPVSYLFGMLIAITAGTYFFVAYCSECKPTPLEDTMGEHSTGAGTGGEQATSIPGQTESTPALAETNPKTN